MKGEKKREERKARELSEVVMKLQQISKGVKQNKATEDE
jgi:hypothetical protein